MKRRLTEKTKELIRGSAGSVYRMNAKTADCYAFTLDYYNGKPSWQGGWDWSDNLVDKGADYIYVFATDEFKKIGG